ncbi:MAG: nuclear transport factor 2 family protein [Solirubrobacterales bacterium]
MHKFRTAVEARDFDAVPPMLAEDAIFRSPVVFKPFEGKTYVAAVLLAALRTLQDFRYETEMVSADGRDHALVFKAQVNGRGRRDGKGDRRDEGRAGRRGLARRRFFFGRLVVGLGLDAQRARRR